MILALVAARGRAAVEDVVGNGSPVAAREAGGPDAAAQLAAHLRLVRGAEDHDLLDGARRDEGLQEPPERAEEPWGVADHDVLDHLGVCGVRWLGL